MTLHVELSFAYCCHNRTKPKNLHNHHFSLIHSLHILNKAQALVEFGDTLKQMADVKYALDDNVKQNFLEPLHQLQMKDLKEVMVSSSVVVFEHYC